MRRATTPAVSKPRTPRAKPVAHDIVSRLERAVVLEWAGNGSPPDSYPSLYRDTLAEIVRLRAEVAEAYKTAAAMLDMSNQTIRLHAGELTPDEMRCVQAVLKWKRREMLAMAEKTSSLSTNQRSEL